MSSILVSNDDGILAPGLQVLAQSLKRLGKVTVVAPSQERSTTGHSLTLHKPIRIEPTHSGFYSINGTPADCVYIGIKKLLRSKPDLVVSGINRGPNLGSDTHYSGTVAVAREATFLKVPAIAISLVHEGLDNDIDFGPAAEYAYQIAKEVLKRGLPEQILLNVNVPELPLRDIKGIRVVRTGFRYYSDRIVEQKDPRGRNYYWLGGKYLGYDPKGETDCRAIDERCVSVTPLHIDATHHETIQRLKKWNLKALHEATQKPL